MGYVTKIVLLIMLALVHENNGGLPPPPVLVTGVTVPNVGNDPQAITSAVPESYIADQSGDSNETQNSVTQDLSTTTQNDSYVDNNTQNATLSNASETASDVNNSASVGGYETGSSNNQSIEMTTSAPDSMSGTSYITDNTTSSTNQSTDITSSDTYSITDTSNTSESKNMSSPENLEQGQISNNLTSSYQNNSADASENEMNISIPSNETIPEQTVTDYPAMTSQENATQVAAGNDTAPNKTVVSDVTAESTTPDMLPSENYTPIGSKTAGADTNNTTDIPTYTSSQNRTIADESPGAYIQKETTTSKTNDTQIVFKQDNGTTTVEISLDNVPSLLGYVVRNETQTDPNITLSTESSAIDRYTTETVTASIPTKVTETVSKYTTPGYENQTEIPIITAITTSSRPTKPVTKAPMSSYSSPPKFRFTTEIYIPPVDLLTLEDPPPIFPGGRRPPTYEDDVAQSLGPFVTRTRQTQAKSPTTAPPPPPIVIPKRQVSPIYNLPVRTTTQAPYQQTSKVLRTAGSAPNPRYMTVAELAELALKNLESSQRQMRKGVQVFFQTVRPLPFEQEKAITPPPYQVFKEPEIMGNPNSKQAITTAPIVEPPKRFFDEGFLLNQIVKNDAGGGKVGNNLQQPNVSKLLKQAQPDKLPTNQDPFQQQPQLNLPQNRQQQKVEQQRLDREQQQKQLLQKLLKEHQAELQELQRRFEKENQQQIQPQQPSQQQMQPQQPNQRQNLMVQSPLPKQRTLERTGKYPPTATQQQGQKQIIQSQQPPQQAQSQQRPQQAQSQQAQQAQSQQPPQQVQSRQQPQQAQSQQPPQQAESQQPQQTQSRQQPKQAQSQPSQLAQSQQPQQKLTRQVKESPRRHQQQPTSGHLKQQQLQQQKEAVSPFSEQDKVQSSTRPFFDSSYLLKQIGLQPSNVQSSSLPNKRPSALSQEIDSQHQIQRNKGQKQVQQINNKLLPQRNNLLLSALNTDSKAKRPRQVQRRRPSVRDGTFTPYVRTGDLFEAQALEAWIKTKSLKTGLLQRVQNEKRTRMNKVAHVKSNPVINSKVINNNIKNNQIPNNIQVKPWTEQQNVATPFINSKEKNNNINFDQAFNKVRMEPPPDQQNAANERSLQTNGLNQIFQRPSHTFSRPREPVYGNNPDNAFKRHSPFKNIDQRASSDVMGPKQGNQGLETRKFPSRNSKPKIGLVASPEGKNGMSKLGSNPIEKTGKIGMADVQQQLPLAKRRGFETVLSDLSSVNNLNLNQLANQLNFRPNIVNDISPKNIIPARTIAESESHWSSKVGNSIKLPSNQVPYFMKTDADQPTTAENVQIAEFTYDPIQKLPMRDYPSSPQPPTVLPIAYVTTTPPLPTIPPTADPNPPPIFDTKVMQTFMPFPKPEATVKPRHGETTSPSTDSQNSAQGFDNRCTGCVFVNDRCLLPDDVHCNMFVECVRQGALVRAFNKECALGSFFDRKSYLCVDPKNADCPQDRCREPGMKWYPVHGHCKHYWSCTSREGGGVYAQSECCPDMGGFDPNVGCVENKSCTDSCGSVVVNNVTEGCHLRKTASPKVYFDTNANIERPCAPGTVFIDRKCTCARDVTVDRSDTQTGAPVCSPMLAVTFENGSIVDTSVNKQHIGIEGIAGTPTGEGIFNGAGRLILWRYANLMFPVVFAVRFRFLSTTDAPRLQTIISNCDPKARRPSTFDISLDTLYNEVVFKVDTLEGQPKKFKQIYQKESWTTVVLIYDGERIVGSVDNRARNIVAPGGIETRPTPFSVGACANRAGFKGLLDDLSVYEDCIPSDMYGIFMSVLE